MNEAILLAVMAVIVIFLMWQMRHRDSAWLQQLAEFNKELADLRTAQLESRHEALLKQTELFQQSQKLVSEQLTGILTAVNDNLGQTQRHITSQLQHTGTVVNDIQTKLGTLDESARQMKEIGKDIASLQDILRAPKLRGGLGEYLLQDLLRQIFPSENFELQHSFAGGMRVDAVIRLAGRLVPIDAKFPLESFRRLTAAASDEEKKSHKREFLRSVRTHIDEIADKYIRPGEGTFDFALMYIPAENVFYEIIVSDTLADKGFEIFQYAVQKHVVPVSPNSFYAYLMAIAFGLRGFHIEQRAREIMGELAQLGEAFSRFFDDLAMLGRHLANAQGKYDDSLKKAEKFKDRLERIAEDKQEALGPEETPPNAELA